MTCTRRVTTNEFFAKEALRQCRNEVDLNNEANNGFQRRQSPGRRKRGPYTSAQLDEGG